MSQSTMYPQTAVRLVDGAAAQGTALSQESRELSHDVCNGELPLIDRLEAYENIINLEVGDTNLTRARNLEREFGFRQLYLKFEGNNPTGTQKDRIAFAQCLDALRRGFDTITVATCGNYGAAIAVAARMAGLKAIICIPESYTSQRIDEITAEGSELWRAPGSYEAVVKFSKQLAVDRDIYDANPGGANTHLQISAYAEIALEIYDTLRDAPRIVAVPVSNGTLLAGVYRGFVSLYKRGKTSRIPRMVAASSYRNNPIVRSFKKGLKHCEDLPAESIKETAVNEPLVNWHSFDGNEALYAVNQSHGWAEDVSDKKLNAFSKLAREKEGLSVLPASTAGMVALLEATREQQLEGDRYVAILTGRK